MITKLEKRIYNNQYYKNMSLEVKSKKVKLQRLRKRKLRIKVINYKTSIGCPCGERHPACLDFHHTSDKEIEISNAVRLGWCWERILKEIKKCELLCANCHRKLHFKPIKLTQAERSVDGNIRALEA